MLVDLLTVQQPEDRRLAAQLLGVRLDAAAVTALRVAARDTNASVRVQALNALGELHDAQTPSHYPRPTTSNPHQADPSPGELRDAEAWPALIGGISDREAQVRQAALLAVGKIGDAELAPYVIMRLRDPSEQVQAAAASALHHMQSAASLAALASCLLGAADAPLLQRSAVASLARWADRAALLHAFGEADCFSKGGPPHARGAACEVLGYVFAAEGRCGPGMVAAVAEHRVRARCTTRAQRSTVASLLSPAAGDRGDGGVQEGAEGAGETAAAVRVRAGGGGETLIGGVTDDVASCVHGAGRVRAPTLAASPTPRPSPPPTQARVLVALLEKEKDAAVKLNAVSALGKLALPLALLPLMPLLKEPDEARAEAELGSSWYGRGLLLSSRALR